jgi:large subunit ribosomal protein L10
VNKAEKSAEILELQKKFDRMVSAVFLNFQGMNVDAITRLRDQFREVGVDYKVVKNTLVKQAVKDKAYADQLKGSLTNMTGVAWSYEDPSAAAKIVTKFRKDNEKLQIKAGLIENQVLDGKAVESTLATMPGKNELRSQLLATFMAPATSLVRVLQAPSQNLALVLEAKRRKESGEDA